MTKAEATEAVRAWARQRVEKPIKISALERHWVATLSGLGVRIDWEKSVNRAYAVGREGNIFERVECVLFHGGTEKSVSTTMLISEPTLAKTISKFKKAVDMPHKDARIRIVDQHLQITQDSCGVKLDEENAAKAIRSVIRTGTAVITLPVIQDKPDVTARDAARINSVLSTYTTSFNSGKRGRTHNLTLAAHEISGVVLNPNQVFSYNTIVGPRLEGRGYRNAQIFVKGKLQEGLGGGVCQVSSTLYNAVLLAGLKVKERGPHSQTVPYVTPGRDATVAYGCRDFRFENSNDSPVAVISTVHGSRLTVQIYGAAVDRKDIRIFTSTPKRIDAGTKIVVDASLQPGERKLVEKGAPGYSVTVYRTIKFADGKSVTQVVSRDRYPAQKTVVAVGGAMDSSVNAVKASGTSSSSISVNTD